MAATASPSAPPATVWAIEARKLSRRYGSVRALNGLDLQVPWDQRLALLGSNGAGKTTFLRILATLVRPTDGYIHVGGLRLPDHAASVRRHIGLVAHQTFLYDELTARENLFFYGRLYQVTSLTGRVDRLLDRVGLANRANNRVRTFSRGLQQRLALARAIIHDPPILLLDEPDTGLDVEGLDLLSTLMVDDAQRPRTVVFTTHAIERALDLGDRVVVLANGKVALDQLATEVSPALLSAWIRGERAAS